MKKHVKWLLVAALAVWGLALVLQRTQRIEREAMPELLPLPDGLDPDLYALAVSIREMATTFEPLREQLEREAEALPTHPDKE